MTGAEARPISGALEAGGRDLVLSRTLAASAQQIWEHLSRSELLATWFGTFTGDPASGTVMVTMTTEPGEATAAEYTIHACDPERLLTVSSAMGEETWRLSLELAAADESTDSAADADGPTDPATPTDGPAGTVVRLHHHGVPGEMLQYVGPGWEWYLDRLTGAVLGAEIPGMDVWDSRYMTLSEDYAALID